MNGKFISEHFVNQKLHVLCENGTEFEGVVKGMVDDILTLRDNWLRFIDVTKVLAVWEPERK
ncbi:MAG: MM0924 family protein [Promethearchaeota archaeon]